MSRLLLVFTLMVVVSCNSTKTASTVSGKINAEAPYLWESQFPKTMLISTEFTGTEATNIQTMGDAWSTALNNRVDFFDYTTGAQEKTLTITNPNQLDDDVFGIYKNVDWLYPEYPDALAVTQIFAYRYNRGAANEYVSIQEADIIVNYDNFEFDDNTISWDYDLRTVILHEMGHFLGLQHKARGTDRNASIMYPSIYNTEIKRVPKAIDISDMASKYTITLGPLHGSAIAADAPNYVPQDAGQAVRILLELKANGDCVHHEDGVEVRRHRVKLK